MEVLKHVPENIAELTPYEPGKSIESVADALGVEPETIVKLASNECALGSSRLAKRAVKQAIDEMHLYPDGNGTALREKIAEEFEVEMDNVILGNGSNEILELIAHSFMGRDKSIVVSEYSFIVYRLLAKMFGARVIQAPVKKEFSHDLMAIKNAITEDTSVVFVCNPNNPTGTVVSDAEVKKFMDAVPEDVLIVFDEAYAEICLSRMPNTIEYIKQQKNCIMLRSFSKSYGLAGLRIGYGIAPKPIIEALQKPRQPFNTTRISQIAALAAIDDAGFVRRCRTLYRKSKNYFEAEFKAMDLNFVTSVTNFMLVETFNGRRVFEEMQKRGVIVRPMDGYGLKDWIRVNYGTQEQNETFMVALREVLCK